VKHGIRSLELEHYLKDIHLLPDFFFIQEHKLRGDKANEVGKVVWRRTASWFTKASPRYSTHDKNMGTNKGGTKILMHE
jgi:hypothetical protein